MSCCNGGIGDIQDYFDATQVFQENPTGYNGGPTGIYTPSGNTSGTNFWDVLSGGLRSASGILGARYAVPQLNPGQLIQTGPYGSVMSQSTNGIPGAASLLGAGGGSSTMLLLGGAALLVFMLAKK